MEDFGDWIWDESEYNFFMSLGDIAKLEYIYDYFNLDLDDMEDVFEIELEYDDEEKPSVTGVDVVITDTHFIITCSDLPTIQRTLGMFKMDGFIILPERVKGDTHFYTYIGESAPFSMN